MRIHTLVAAGAAGVELASISQSRTRLFIQNISDSEIVSLYNKPGKEHEGIFLYPHQWVQLDVDDDCGKLWYVFSETGGTTNIHVIEWFPDPDDRTTPPPTEEPRIAPPRIEAI